MRKALLGFLLLAVFSIPAVADLSTLPTCDSMQEIGAAPCPWAYYHCLAATDTTIRRCTPAGWETVAGGGSGPGGGPSCDEWDTDPLCGVASLADVCVTSGTGGCGLGSPGRTNKYGAVLMYDVDYAGFWGPYYPAPNANALGTPFLYWDGSTYRVSAFSYTGSAFLFPDGAGSEIRFTNVANSIYWNKGTALESRIWNTDNDGSGGGLQMETNNAIHLNFEADADGGTEDFRVIQNAGNIRYQVSGETATTLSAKHRFYSGVGSGWHRLLEGGAASTGALDFVLDINPAVSNAGTNSIRFGTGTYKIGIDSTATGDSGNGYVGCTIDANGHFTGTCVEGITISPGGSPTELQFHDSGGAFDGVTGTTVTSDTDANSNTYTKITAEAMELTGAWFGNMRFADFGSIQWRTNGLGSDPHASINATTSSTQLRQADGLIMDINANNTAPAVDDRFLIRSGINAGDNSTSRYHYLFQLNSATDHAANLHTFYDTTLIKEDLTVEKTISQPQISGGSKVTWTEPLEAAGGQTFVMKFKDPGGAADGTDVDLAADAECNIDSGGRLWGDCIPAVKSFSIWYDLAITDDGIELRPSNDDDGLQLEKIYCRCQSGCSALPTIRFHNRADTVSAAENVICSTAGTWVTLSAPLALVNGDGINFSVEDATPPDGTNRYMIGFAYKSVM